MGIAVHTGESALDAMLTDFALLWKQYSGNVCICSDKTLAQADTVLSDGYIVLVRDSGWQYTAEGRTFLDTHAHCLTLTCPVSYAELEDALFRLAAGRTGEGGEAKVHGEQAEIYPIAFDTDKNCISVQGNTIVLTPTEYKLFQILYAHKGEIVPRQVLVQAVWKGGVTGNRCDVHLAGLRRKLIPVFGKGVLTCIRGAGYVFRG